MMLDLTRFSKHISPNPNGDGLLVSEDCPDEILTELRKANEEYTEIMGKPLLIFP